MKIAELTVYHVRIPLKKPIRHASHRRTDTDNLLVRCVLEDKTEGWGEGVRATTSPAKPSTRLWLCFDAATWRRNERTAPILPAPRPSPSGCGWPTCRATTAASRATRLDAPWNWPFWTPMAGASAQPVSRTTRLLAPDLYQPRAARCNTAAPSPPPKASNCALAAWAMRLVWLPSAEGEGRHRRPG